MQIDLLPNLPISGGYQTVMTAIDVFCRYLFAYPLVEATASNTAKVLIDIMTKHTYLPTTLIADKGTAFTSKIFAEIEEILGITPKCANTKHPQTIGKLERTHASLKINLKWPQGNIADSGINTYHWLYSTTILLTTLVLVVSQVRFSMDGFCITS